MSDVFPTTIEINTNKYTVSNDCKNKLIVKRLKRKINLNKYHFVRPKTPI